MQISSLALSLSGLVFVLALVLLAGRVARGLGLPERLGLPGRLGVRQADGRLAAAQVLPIDGRRRLHLLQCDGRGFLLLTGGTQDVFLGWVDAPAPGPRP